MSVPTDHPFAFDPTHGFGLAELRALRPPPAPPGFDAFWQERHRRACAVDPRPCLTPSAACVPRWRMHDLRYTSTDGVAIGGWLLEPRAGAVRRGLVVGHGYGGRATPDVDLPVEETAILFLCFRGLSRSASTEIPPDAARHVLHGIEDRDRYVLGGCVEDLWVAVTVLAGLYPGLEGRIGYSGLSFGGGLGALAVPFDTRIDRGHLVVPTFGNMPLWLTLPSTGSSRAVQAYESTHGDLDETLRFFDAAVAATRITIPMIVAPALFDPAVAPPCQFTVANALYDPDRHETVVLDAGHFDYPGMEAEHAALTDKVRAHFAIR